MRTLKKNREGFVLFIVFIISLSLAGLLTVVFLQTLSTLDATHAADEALRQSHGAMESTP